MKILINAESNDFLNHFIAFSEDKEYGVVVAKAENSLFENIENGDIDAYVLITSTSYFKKAIEFIKKSNPHTLIIALIPSAEKANYILHGLISGVDIYMPVETYDSVLANSLLFNIEKHKKTFATLQKLTAKMHDKIEFATCVYDPSTRILSHKGKEVKKFSAKEGGILEILAINFGEIVKKEVILEKVWHKTDYFAGRSMDVYITYLRNTLKTNKIKLQITNTSGIGLTLELER